MSSKFLFLGRVGRARGLDGSFFVTERLEILPPLKTVYLKIANGELQAYLCSRIYMSGDKPVMKLADIKDRNAAENLRNAELFMQNHELALDPSKEYLWQSLLGRIVVDLTGTTLGTVRRLENHGAHDILVVEHAGMCCDLPMVAEYVEMSFDSLNHGEGLRLKVPGDYFADLWYEEN